ncbi:MAG: hypothetical protein ABEJ73_00245 [Haloplanus sp.]
MERPSTPDHDAESATAADSKATLFCPDCGHASPVDGDWDVRAAGDRRRVRCPDCRRVIDDRRVRDHPTRVDDHSTPVQWCVDAWDRYWSAWSALVTGGSAGGY